MNVILFKIKHFIRNSAGASAMEYCLLLAGIALLVVVSLPNLGSNMNKGFNSANLAMGQSKGPNPGNNPGPVDDGNGKNNDNRGNGGDGKNKDNHGNPGKGKKHIPRI
jgi:Flp pilus assembly pilin Flp